MTSLRIGLIADTHGLLRPQALASLADCAMILHAGDVGKAEVITRLQALAPVHAVRGNVDRGTWADELPSQASVVCGGLRFLILHDLGELRLDPKAADYHVVVSGHSHRPSIAQRDGVLYVNPGSAGPRRFKLPVSLGVVELVAGRAVARIRRLDIGDAETPRLGPRPDPDQSNGLAS